MTLTAEAIIRLGVEMRKAQETRYKTLFCFDGYLQSIDTAERAQAAFDTAASEYLAQIEREK